jgi:hypothetical protein
MICVIPMCPEVVIEQVRGNGWGLVEHLRWKDQTVIDNRVPVRFRMTSPKLPEGCGTFHVVRHTGGLPTPGEVTREEEQPLSMAGTLPCGVHSSQCAPPLHA